MYFTVAQKKPKAPQTTNKTQTQSSKLVLFAFTFTYHLADGRPTVHCRIHLSRLGRGKAPSFLLAELNSILSSITPSFFHQRVVLTGKWWHPKIMIASQKAMPKGTTITITMTSSQKCIHQSKRSTTATRAAPQPPCSTKQTKLRHTSFSTLMSTKPYSSVIQLAAIQFMNVWIKLLPSLLLWVRVTSTTVVTTRWWIVILRSQGLKDHHRQEIYVIHINLNLLTGGMVCQ